MNHKTQFMLAQQVTSKKERSNTTSLLKSLAERAVKIHAKFVSDCIPHMESHSTKCIHATPLMNSVHIIYSGNAEKTHHAYLQCSNKQTWQNELHKMNNKRFNSIRQVCCRPRRGVNFVSLVVITCEFSIHIVGHIHRS